MCASLEPVHEWCTTLDWYMVESGKPNTKVSIKLIINYTSMIKVLATAVNYIGQFHDKWQQVIISCDQ